MTRRKKQNLHRNKKKDTQFQQIKKIQFLKLRNNKKKKITQKIIQKK